MDAIIALRILLSLSDPFALANEGVCVSVFARESCYDSCCDLFDVE
jgi:hypothetical protein